MNGCKKRTNAEKMIAEITKLWGECPSERVNPSPSPFIAWLERQGFTKHTARTYSSALSGSKGYQERMVRRARELRDQFGKVAVVVGLMLLLAPGAMADGTTCEVKHDGLGYWTVSGSNTPAILNADYGLTTAELKPEVSSVFTPKPDARIVQGFAIGDKGDLQIVGAPDLQTITRLQKEYKKQHHQSLLHSVRHPAAAHPRAWRVFRTRVLPATQFIGTILGATFAIAAAVK